MNPNDIPSKYKLTGDGRRLWQLMVVEYGPVLKNRHLPLLFAMCQQWDLYQTCLAKQKRNKSQDRERQLHYQVVSSLKMFQSLSKEFKMGINDQLQFTIPEHVAPKPKVDASESRLAQLLSSTQKTPTKETK